MKKVSLFLLFAFIVNLSFASNKHAIDYYDAGDLNKAKELFLSSSKLDATDFYYLGKIYFREGDEAKAKESFDKGLALDPEFLYNKVGLSALLLKTNKKEADKQLKAISRHKQYKKDANMQVEIAEIYARNKMNDLAQIYIAKAKKADKKSALPYILEGNLLMEQRKSNDAAVMFENALYFDPNSKIALVKLAQLYVGTRRQIAFEHLDKATSIDPNYLYGWKTQADLRREVGFYKEAKEAFEKYLTLVEPTPEDYQIYGQILYFSDDFDQALEALNKADDNTVTTRLKMYSKYKQDKYDEAIPLAEKLIQNTAKDKLIYQDYTNYSKMLIAQKEYSKAAEYYEAAYELDPEGSIKLSDVAKLYERGKDFEKAIEYYQKIVDAGDYTMADIYNLGVANYTAGNDAVTYPDVDKRVNFLTKATEVFGEMKELFPDHYLGLLSQARAQSSIDPETKLGLAKPYYEEVMPMLLQDEEARKSEILEANIYLAVYYFKKDEYRKSKPYWEKVLELDPDNASAKQVLESLKTVL